MNADKAVSLFFMNTCDVSNLDGDNCISTVYGGASRMRTRLVCQKKPDGTKVFHWDDKNVMLSADLLKLNSYGIGTIPQTSFRDVLSIRIHFSALKTNKQ